MRKSPFNDDELFSLVGRAVVSWQDVEENAYLVFCMCLRPLAQASVREIWNSHPSFHGQLKLLQKLMTLQPLPNERAAQWADLMKRMHQLVAVRNRIAHSRLTVAPSAIETPPVIAFEISERTPPFGRNGPRMSAEVLEKAGQDFVSVSIELMSFAGQFIEAA